MININYNSSPEGSVLSRLINVGDSAEKGAEDDLGVVLEEVDLHGAVSEVHHHGPASSEPGLEGGNTGELVLLPDLHVGPGLEEVLLHVVPEVVQQLPLLLHGGRELVHGVVVLEDRDY